jgi:uncharacterized membrane protein
MTPPASPGPVAPPPKQGFFRRAQRNILAGIIAIIPIWITYLVFDFFVRQLSRIGRPWAEVLSGIVQTRAPELAEWMLAPWFQNTLAVVLTISVLYFLGWLTTRVLGKRLLGVFDLVMHRIPLVERVYGLIKKLLSALQKKPEDVQRVVLIEFPSEFMKTVGFVTRVFRDHYTGQQLAAVYVPTTPNPTSGYLEIVPLERLVSLEWTMDEAMTFIISGGAVAPDNIHYNNPPAEPAPEQV